MHRKWQYARQLRTSATDAERLLWRCLRQRQLNGWKFRRQYPIAGFIADFACIEQRLVMELDGGQHAERSAYDANRTAVMASYGFRVLRFWNNEVMSNLEGVVAVIGGAAVQPHPGPPLQGRGGWETP